MVQSTKHQPGMSWRRPSSPSYRANHSIWRRTPCQAGAITESSPEESTYCQAITGTRMPQVGRFMGRPVGKTPGIQPSSVLPEVNSRTALRASSYSPKAK